MIEEQRTFSAVNDEQLAQAIRRARNRVVYAAPGVGSATARALVDRLGEAHGLILTVILDPDGDAYRIGYGDPGAFKALSDAALNARYSIRRQPGLRLGLLVVDDEAIIWSPTPRAVEAERDAGEPNGLVLGGVAAQVLGEAVGVSSTGLSPEAEIGKEVLTPAEVETVARDLEQNPPAPFDLSRRTRVFSTRFQFVEFEVRGAEWTARRVRLSSFLLNADLPEPLQEVVDTYIRPFQTQADVALDVPLVVRGQRAFREDGRRIEVPATQAEILKEWNEIRSRYLRQVKGFGWLVRRDHLQAFQGEVEAFEEVLAAWVDKFRERIGAEEDQLIRQVVGAINQRLAHAPRALGDRPTEGRLKELVRAGLDRLRTVEPRVKIVVKDISWLGSRDAEFIAALQEAIPPAELEGWFEEFTAARQVAEGAA